MISTISINHRNVHETNIHIIRFIYEVILYVNDYVEDNYSFFID